MNPFNFLMSITAALMIMMASVGCKPLDKAVKKVLADPASKELVGREWEKANPCDNDTVLVPGKPIYIKGKDSFTVVNVPYAAYRYRTLDTSIKGTKIKIDSAGNVSLLVKEPIPDTVYQPRDNYITDNRRLNIALDSVRFYTMAFKVSDNEKKRLQAEHGEFTTMLKYTCLALLGEWWFWLLIVLTAAFFFIRSRLSFLNIFNSIK